MTDALLAQLQMELDALEERLRQESIARLIDRHGGEVVTAWRESGRQLDLDEAIAVELSSGVHAAVVR
jgi:hypothetical protein